MRQQWWLVFPLFALSLLGILYEKGNHFMLPIMERRDSVWVCCAPSNRVKLADDIWMYPPDSKIQAIGYAGETPNGRWTKLPHFDDKKIDLWRFGYRQYCSEWLLLAPTKDGGEAGAILRTTCSEWIPNGK